MDAARRATLGFAMLVLLWVLVYWWWEPSPRSISYDPLAAGLAEQSEASSASAARRPPIEPARPLPVGTGSSAPTASSAQAPSIPTPGTTPGTTLGPTQAPTQARSEPPRPERGVIAPQFRDYTVRPGDTFQAIARRELGSGEYASAIARANPLLDPTRIRAGQVIRIPIDPANIQGREIVTQTTRARPAAVQYTVKSGDTLSGISRDFYGTTAHADHILNANRAVIPGARQLRAGQVIVIPPPPTSADGASGPGAPRQEE